MSPTLNSQRRYFTLTCAERVALAGALLIVFLQVTPWAPALEYRVALLGTQPWRVLTGHFVHLNWQHALINAAAWWVVARLYAPDLNAKRQVFAIVLSMLAISYGLAIIYPSIVWYRGFSGALHGLFFTGASTWLCLARPRSLRILWLPAALFFGGWIKVLMEQPGGALTPQVEWMGAGVVPQAHLIGAFCGTALGIVFAALDARRDSAIRASTSDQQ